MSNAHNDHTRPSGYAQQVGDRLRNTREQQQLSLADVQERSGGEVKASILGAYERGERNISVPRLQRLAALYGVPIDQLLPPVPGHPLTPQIAVPTGGICIDLTALRRHQERETRGLSRFVAMLQRRRGDFNGRVLTIRSEDAYVLAATIGQPTTQFLSRLDRLGIRRKASSG